MPEMKISLINQIGILIKKEILAEWKNKYALLSIILLLFSSVFIVYTIQHTTDNVTWHSLFYVMLIFGVTQNIARSFLAESAGNILYYKYLVDNRAVIASKIIYQFMVNLIFLGVLYILMNFFLIQDIKHLWQYVVTAILFTLCNSAIFTFNAAIASGARNSSLIALVLSLPLLIPNLIISLKSASVALSLVDNVTFYQDWLVMLLLTGIVSVLAVVLFRNIWSS